MSRKYLRAKVKSCITITLLSILLFLPTVQFSNGMASGILLKYDRDNPDCGHSGTEPLAVRFTPPVVYLGMGKTCTLFKITAIRLYLYCDSNSAGFDVDVTDQNHQAIKSFPDRDPTVDGWYDIDLTGWTSESRYVDTHFFVEFRAHAPDPNSDETWATLWFDEAVVGEGEASYKRSYRYTDDPDNPNSKVWLPIELTYPYGPGDLMIRVELEPQTPEKVLPRLIEEISSAEDYLFSGPAASRKATLIKKIVEVISMFEKGNYQGGLNKLENDIAPKLADPRPTPESSWLNPKLDYQKQVTSFAVQCQVITQMVEKAVPMTITMLEHYDFNGDFYDDLAVGVPGENIEGEDDAGAVNVLYGSADGVCETGDDYWHQNVANVDGECEENDQFGAALAIGNFNGDGFDDLAIGIPGDEVDDVAGAGSVYILYGSLSGLTTADDQLWHQNSEGIDGVCEAGDSFGAALAVGDFDGDGYDDLAIGTPREDYYGHTDAGVVTVLYGSFDGLIPYDSQLWIQSDYESSDLFGSALTAGDFNDDDCDDLAIGAPGEDIPDINSMIYDAGIVNVLYGSSAGLSASGNQVWSQDSLSWDESEWNDRFGDVLAAGDFNCDGYEDLVVGVPRENLGWDPVVDGTGAVHIIYGSSIGLTAVGNQLINEEWCTGEFEAGENFGASLAVGDFDGDGYVDLAVGAPNKNVVTPSNVYENAGVFYVIYGSDFGLEWSDKCRMWAGYNCLLGGFAGWSYNGYQKPNGGYSEADDYFGKALCAGDFDGDFFCDLAVGVPGKDVQYFLHSPPGHFDVIYDAGTVDILYGSESGLWEVNGKTWHQDMAGIGGTSEEGDSFGSSLPSSPSIGSIGA